MIIVNIVMRYVIKFQYAVCCHDGFLLSKSFIVYISLSYVIKFHEQYVFFQWVSKIYV